MSKYTVKQVKPTGKVDEKFGTEYHVQFNEDDRVVKVSRKTEVTVGQEFDGEIKDNSYGAYFKSAPRDFTATAGSAAPAGTRRAPFVRKDNSDGMRQGMCINNAANFVNALSFADMTADAWATMVYDYANALYAKGDLTGEVADQAAEQQAEDFKKSVEDVFGK